MRMRNCSSSSSSLPVGYHFEPTDEELCGLLACKVGGEELSCSHVAEIDVYSCEPWEIKDRARGNGCVKGYYFVKREMKATLGNGKTPKRTIKGQSFGGWWRSSTGDKPIPERGPIIGHKRTLNYFQYNNEKRDRKECKKTSWIMHEYTLHSSSVKFQKWALCHIKNKEEKDHREGVFEIDPEIQAMIESLTEQNVEEDGVQILQGEKEDMSSANDEQHNVKEENGCQDDQDCSLSLDFSIDKEFMEFFMNDILYQRD